MNNAELDKKVSTLATKAELKSEQDKILNLQAFDSSYFRGKSHFEEDGTQNYLVFQPMYRYFLMKLLNPHLQLIIVLLQDSAILVIKQE